MKRNQVYILCREAGKDIGINIKEALEKRRYSVFLDVDSEKDISTIIKQQKNDESIDFIPILTQNAWKRIDKNDTYIEKLKKALDEKNVIPIITRGVIYPSANELDDEIKDLANRNALPDNAVPQCFDGIMERLDRVFLTSHHKIDERSRYFLYSASILAVFLILFSGVYCINYLKKYPIFTREFEEVSRAISHFTYSLTSRDSKRIEKNYYTELFVIYKKANDYITYSIGSFEEIKKSIDDFKVKYTYEKDSDIESFNKLDNSKMTKDLPTCFSEYVKYEEYSIKKFNNRLDLIERKMRRKDIPSDSNYIKEWPLIYIKLQQELKISELYKSHYINLLLSNIDFYTKEKNSSYIIKDFVEYIFIRSSNVNWEMSKEQLIILFEHEKKQLDDLEQDLGM